MLHSICCAQLGRPVKRNNTLKNHLKFAAVALVGFGVLQAAPASAVPVQWGGNGHYYELISGTFTSSQAFSGAAAQTHLGVSGHLVTITSAGEQSFLNTLTGGSELYHIGASDSASEGDWTWLVGPEAGAIFESSGVVQAGFYSNWSGGEPNNAGGAEHLAIANWGVNGSWNDIAGTSDQVLSYVVEFSIEVPAPGAAAIFGLAIAGLGFARRKRQPANIGSTKRSR